MFPLIIVLLLAPTQGSAWGLDELMVCLSGSSMAEKAQAAIDQCSEAGQGGPATRSLLERQAFDCPALEGLGLEAANSTGPDCILSTMGYLAPGGGVHNKVVLADLETLNPDVFARYSMGITAEAKWNHCKKDNGYKQAIMKFTKANCADIYTEAELTTLQHYGARLDTIRCLGAPLQAACQG